MICEEEEIPKYLRDILMKSNSLFRESPGWMECYEHGFKVMDDTPYFQRGWPVPIAYKHKVDAEINKMLKYGVIERCNSPVSYTHLDVYKRQ